MRKLFLLTIIFATKTAMGWTLNNNFGASFKYNSVEVKVAGNTSCSQAGVTVYELKDMISPAIEHFWNRVPTSKLRLSNGGFSDAITNIQNGRLCGPTDEACISAAAGNVIEPVTDIIIGCNSGANFGGPSVLAVTIPNNFSGNKITGAVILINDSAGSVFANLSREDKISVIAHEIGHAIGLGHSENRDALMYFRTVEQRRALGEDDMEGVSFLYPMKIDGFGLLGGCASLDDQQHPPRSPGLFTMFLSLLMMIVVFELRRLFQRRKTRSSL
jgi:hypothetical protein